MPGHSRPRLAMASHGRPAMRGHGDHGGHGTQKKMKQQHVIDHFSSSSADSAHHIEVVLLIQAKQNWPSMANRKRHAMEMQPTTGLAEHTNGFLTF